MSICNCHRVLPALSNATYGKRVEKGAETLALAQIGALVLSLLQQELFIAYLLVYFSNRGSHLELVAPLKGLASCTSG